MSANEATNVTLMAAVTEAGVVGLACTPSAGDTMTVTNIRISAIQVAYLAVTSL